MVMNECSACPRCGGRLKYYDSVPRLVRTKGRQTSRVPMRRLRCSGCGAIHREMGGLFFPYKQYEAEVIFGVLEGLITCETLGFEDYPCEMTMLMNGYHKLQELIEEFTNGDAKIVKVEFSETDYKSPAICRSCLAAAIKRSKRPVKVWRRGNEIFLSKDV